MFDTQVVNYKEHRAQLDKAVRNLESLPAGTSCPYLLTIKGQGETLVAKQWKRKAPKSLNSNEILIKF